MAELNAAAIPLPGQEPKSSIRWTENQPKDSAWVVSKVAELRSLAFGGESRKQTPQKNFMDSFAEGVFFTDSARYKFLKLFYERVQGLDPEKAETAARAGDKLVESIFALTSGRATEKEAVAIKQQLEVFKIPENIKNVFVNEVDWAMDHQDLMATMNDLLEKNQLMAITVGGGRGRRAAGGAGAAGAAGGPPPPSGPGWGKLIKEFLKKGLKGDLGRGTNWETANRRVVIFGVKMLFAGTFALICGLGGWVASQTSGLTEETFDRPVANENNIGDIYGERWLDDFRTSKGRFTDEFNDGTLDPSKFKSYFGDLNLNDEESRTSILVTLEAYKAAMIESGLFDSSPTRAEIEAVFIGKGYDSAEAAYFANLFDELLRPQINLEEVLQTIESDANQWQEPEGRLDNINQSTAWKQAKAKARDIRARQTYTQVRQTRGRG